MSQLIAPTVSNFLLDTYLNSFTPGILVKVRNQTAFITPDPEFLKPGKEVAGQFVAQSLKIIEENLGVAIIMGNHLRVRAENGQLKTIFFEGQEVFW